MVWKRWLTEMKRLEVTRYGAWLAALLGFLVMNESLAQDADEIRLAELDAYWKEVSTAVRKGDFEGYKATMHPLGTLVSGARKTSYPLTEALQRWKPGFDATASGSMEADVQFRFSQRLGDATTAHETGIFRYSSAEDGAAPEVAYIHFEGLLVKQDRWLIMMEYQKRTATKAEWEALAR